MFIYSGAAYAKKIHMMDWPRLCLPKICGGRGLKNLGVMKGALLMKLSWGIISSPNSFWVQVLYEGQHLSTRFLKTQFLAEALKTSDRLHSKTKIKRKD